MSDEATQSGSPAERADRKVMRGQVKSNKMQKTVVIEVSRKVRHPLYEKYISRRTKLYAHDENNEAKVGDIVEVMQTRPLSKLKRWRLIRVVQRAAQD
ncbi:MAG: 30S ribosomal protein S17 [Planctomycetota bacterium]|jgi:small subunit ribosomal protein S17|nr:30S ribosomal protein S17 [Planctomycetota bacterium]MSR38096.1 30S ribosomal protein S17 [Planctomycetota bacterium]